MDIWAEGRPSQGQERPGPWTLGQGISKLGRAKYLEIRAGHSRAKQGQITGLVFATDQLRSF
jgi:hypothetical protein